MTSPPTTAQWAALTQKRVVFAHQSVGNDILDGVRSIASQQGQSLAVMETRRVASDWSGIAHFKVGKNGDPQGKIADFVAAMSGGAFPAADVAILKLCYMDFDAATQDPSKLATEYGDALERLQSQFPATRFVAATAPLTTIQTGPKAWIKRLLGRAPAGYEENFRRHVFNERIRNRFSADRLLDIAKLETAAEDGPKVFEYDSQRIEALNPALTYDGGHLDSAGKAIIAAQFVKLVAAEPSSAD